MKRFRAVSLVAVGVLVFGLASVALAIKEQPRPIPPPDAAVGRLSVSGPFVILQQGDTTWIQCHSDTTHCPGDPLEGHGGEATGGPTGAQTWCFEDAVAPDGEKVIVSDTCGTNSPWDVECWDHIDVRSLPSQVGINYWHLDTYRAHERAYCGDFCLWCGSDSVWAGDGLPVECGTWSLGGPPGYGDQWNCHVKLTLDGWTTGRADGCTLAFDPRYDTECKYDYFYVDFYTGTEWENRAMFNAASNNPGGPCGTSPDKANPDYWGNTDVGQPNSASWQTRPDPNLPAYFTVIPCESLPDSPEFRWRFVSDGAWSDADGRGDTDGACFIDNVRIQSDGMLYEEDFEDGSEDTLTARGWTYPDPDPVLQAWHQHHDPDPPYEGGDGGDRTTCTLDSSVVWKGRPVQGYMKGQPWRSGWFYRLLSPEIPITNTGCVWQYDNFMCSLDYTCDYTDTKVRFYDGVQDKWCPWVNIDGFILYGGCFFWNFDSEENVTPFYGPGDTYVQFGWDLMDVSSVGDFCRNKHAQTENIVDNASVGFFDGDATIFSARVIDILQDSFHDSICAYNSFFSAYELDTLRKYNNVGGADPIPKEEQLYAEVTDKDDIVDIRLYGSIDEGQTWVFNAMTQAEAADPTNPAGGGEYYGNFCPEDFSLVELWTGGIEIWYYVWVEDGLANVEYWPSDANPGDPEHTGTREDYFTFSIMPMFPPDYIGTKVLLVDGYGRNNYDYAECFAAADNVVPLEDIYEQTLVDAGYCYDKYDISGAGSNVHIHPLQYTSYDVVVWFTGPYFSNYLFDKEAQEAIRTYLEGGGKFLFCGDRIAYNMADQAEGGVGEDSLNGQFLAGIMGTDYLTEMEGHFVKPYVYLEAAPVCSVFASEVEINLDTLLIYRECPYLKDQSYGRTIDPAPGGYRAQPLLSVLNADPLAPVNGIADGATYVEVQGIGQAVYFGYDFSGFATHRRTECPGGAPPHDAMSGMAYDAGAYYGRVDFMLVVLWDLFGLPPTFPGGGGGTSDVKPRSQFKWALGQNFPNPASANTEIRFEVARTSDVSIKVYNAMGQLVRTLKDGRLDPGRYSTHWDGTNTSGHRVSSGVYFYKMESGQFAATKKMLMVK